MPGISRSPGEARVFIATANSIAWAAEDGPNRGTGGCECSLSSMLGEVRLGNDKVA
jgi:hypothetical protein